MINIYVSNCPFRLRLTIMRYALERLIKEFAPMNIKVVHPRRILIRLKRLYILVGSLLLHRCEARMLEIWKPFPELS